MDGQTFLIQAGTNQASEHVCPIGSQRDGAQVGMEDPPKSGDRSLNSHMTVHRPDQMRTADQRTRDSPDTVKRVDLGSMPLELTVVQTVLAMTATWTEPARPNANWWTSSSPAATAGPTGGVPPAPPAFAADRQQAPPPSGRTTNQGTASSTATRPIMCGSPFPARRRCSKRHSEAERV